jgi:tRNA A-37 threonylcarbamoyl transferase component Bud32/tetratricopeptide (TPR) repeat protein/TolB-like protein
MASSPTIEERLRSALADRYDIRGEIGRGGMATVYLATDLKHRRNVAVKLLNPELSKGLAGQRFLREIEVASTLHHPHILPLYDSGQAEDLVYFVMPYVEGGSLRSRLELEKQLPLEEAVRITRQVGNALAFAHERGVVHRDIKPGNILMEAGHAILADFGVAKAAARAKDDRITRAGSSLGTPAYMSPEQVSGERDVDGRSDQYALACVLYEMLTGEPPFTGPLEESVARQHITADPPPVTRVRPSVPPRVTDAISQALAKTPADRFRTMDEFGRALGRSGEGGWGAVSPRLVRRKPGLLGLLQAMAQAVRKRKGRSIVTFGMVAVLLLFLKFWEGAQPTPLGALAERSFQDSVAILPLEVLGGDPALLDLASMVLQDIVLRFKRSGVVNVREPYSVRKLDALGLTAGQIADTLKVDRLITGTLFSTGEGPGAKLVWTVQWQDVSTSTMVDARRYEADLPPSQEAARSLAEAFVGDFLAIYPDKSGAGVQGPSLQGPGYDAYLVGANLLGRRTPAEMRRARESFELALQQDPRNAYALSGLSKYYALADVYRYRTGAEGYQTAGLAYAYARRAIELEPNLADGYTARSLMARRSFAPTSQVAKDCERAMELEPGGAESLAWCAQTLRLEGDDDQGFRAAEKAINMDPQNAGRRMSLAYIALAVGDFPRAGFEANLAWQLEPDMMAPRAVEAWALLLAGKPGDCASRELGPHAVLRATCLHEMGRQQEAAAIVDSVRSAVESGTVEDEVFNEVVRTGDLAIHYAWLGDQAESLRWLRRSYQLSPSGVDTRVLSSALFDKVRQVDGFEEELEEIQSGIWGRVEAAGAAAYRERFVRR